eukprot:g18525.t1
MDARSDRSRSDLIVLSDSESPAAAGKPKRRSSDQRRALEAAAEPRQGQEHGSVAPRHRQTETIAVQAEGADQEVTVKLEPPDGGLTLEDFEIASDEQIGPDLDDGHDLFSSRAPSTSSSSVGHELHNPKEALAFVNCLLGALDAAVNGFEMADAFTERLFELLSASTSIPQSEKERVLEKCINLQTQHNTQHNGGRGSRAPGATMSSSSSSTAHFDSGRLRLPAPTISQPLSVPVPTDRAGTLGERNELQVGGGMQQQLKQLLERRFSLREFRGKQELCISAILQNKDVLAVMPTGAGKSLCYQLPAVLWEGKKITVVVSPLKSLMKDQVDGLRKKGINAVALHGDVPWAEERQWLHAIEQLAVATSTTTSGAPISLLYVSPEKLVAALERTTNSRDRNASFISLPEVLHSLHNADKLAFFVIDEAHCVSEWGLDFRPEFRKLVMLRHKFPNVPLFACTASATEACRADIANLLFRRGISSNSSSTDKNNCSAIFVDSFNRANLSFLVKAKETNLNKNNADAFFDAIVATVHDALQQDFIRNSSMNSSAPSSYHSAAQAAATGCCVLYCLSKVECDTVAKGLKGKGIKARAYHAGLSPDARRAAQEAWMNGKIQHEAQGRAQAKIFTKLEAPKSTRAEVKDGLTVVARYRDQFFAVPSIGIRSRTAILESLADSQTPSVIVATVAFGMGINKSDVRFIGHLVMPSSIERYYQEVGRAGRDGRHATCVCWFSEKDYERNKRLLAGSSGPAGCNAGKFLTQLNAMRDFLAQNVQCLPSVVPLHKCRRKALLEYFGERDFDARLCGNKCDVCMAVNSGSHGAPGAARGSSSTSSGGGVCAVAASNLNMTTAERQNRANAVPATGSSAFDVNAARDLTEQAQTALRYFRDCLGCDLTVAKLRDALLGLSLPKPNPTKSNSRGGKKRGRGRRRKGGNNNFSSDAWVLAQNRKRDQVMQHRLFGSLKGVASKPNAEKLLRRMVELNIFTEIVKSNASSGNSNSSTSKRGRGGFARNRNKKQFSWTVLGLGPQQIWQEVEDGRLRVAVSYLQPETSGGTTPSGAGSSSAAGDDAIEDFEEFEDDGSSEEETSDSEVEPTTRLVGVLTAQQQLQVPRPTANPFALAMERNRRLGATAATSSLGGLGLPGSCSTPASSSSLGGFGSLHFQQYPRNGIGIGTAPPAASSAAGGGKNHGAQQLNLNNFGSIAASSFEGVRGGRAAEDDLGSSEGDRTDEDEKLFGSAATAKRTKTAKTAPAGAPSAASAAVSAAGTGTSTAPPASPSSSATRLAELLAKRRRLNGGGEERG